MVRVLHDRKIPGSSVNIDHLVVCPGGVFVIDAKKYAGRPKLRTEGGLFRAREEMLFVNRRNRTNLVDSVLHQVALVRAVLVDSPVEVTGMRCFAGADWPLVGGSFTTRGVVVASPRRARREISRPGQLSTATIAELHRRLAGYFGSA